MAVPNPFSHFTFIRDTQRVCAIYLLASRLNGAVGNNDNDAKKAGMDSPAFSIAKLFKRDVEICEIQSSVIKRS